MSYVRSYVHCVFSTKERRPFITAQLRERLWPYLGGIAKENRMKAVRIGGAEDHVHLLLSFARDDADRKSHAAHQRRFVQMGA